MPAATGGTPTVPRSATVPSTDWFTDRNRREADVAALPGAGAWFLIEYITVTAPAGALTSGENVNGGTMRSGRITFSVPAVSSELLLSFASTTASAGSTMTLMRCSPEAKEGPGTSS